MGLDWMGLGTVQEERPVMKDTCKVDAKRQKISRSIKFDKEKKKKKIIWTWKSLIKPYQKGPGDNKQRDIINKNKQKQKPVSCDFTCKAIVNSEAESDETNEWVFNHDGICNSEV